MKKENWELEWIKFVREVMCPARCGRLRFKVKKLIKDIRDKQKEEIREKIKNAGMGYWGTKAYNEGYAQAQADILKKINK